MMSALHGTQHHNRYKDRCCVEHPGATAATGTLAGSHFSQLLITQLGDLDACLSTARASRSTWHQHHHEQLQLTIAHTKMMTIIAAKTIIDIVSSIVTPT